MWGECECVCVREREREKERERGEKIQMSKWSGRAKGRFGLYELLQQKNENKLSTFQRKEERQEGKKGKRRRLSLIPTLFTSHERKDNQGSEEQTRGKRDGSGSGEREGGRGRQWQVPTGRTNRQPRRETPLTDNRQSRDGVDGIATIFYRSDADIDDSPPAIKTFHKILLLTECNNYCT